MKKTKIITRTKKSKKPTIHKLMSEMDVILKERGAILKTLKEKDAMIDRLVRKVNELTHLTTQC